MGLFSYYAEPSNFVISKTTFAGDTMNGPGATKFMVPTVINGHIYVAGQQPNTTACTPQNCYGAVTQWVPQ